ncbi:hepatic lectin-like [Archocentrus centrarchus]|uniref:hepatic lectin-like n=1 Tax=Archocentrus centrarchus TaxID=63155 RepID=UPI0011E9B861|nr:hepatic lectin-like [Archocentrus centrarchus]
MLRNLEVKLETVKSEVTERLPEIQPCPTVQPTCPPQPEVKMNEPCYRCEAGWEHHGGKCYYFSTRKSPWNESRADCRAEGGDLVKIDSREEQSFLRKIIQQKMKGDEDRFWMGLTDSAAEGSWVWVDSSPLNESLTFWSSNEPDDRREEDPDGEDCGRMGPMNWSDKSCKSPQRSICAKPAESLCVSDRSPSFDSLKKSFENFGNMFKNAFNL